VRYDVATGRQPGFVRPAPVAGDALPGHRRRHVERLGILGESWAALIERPDDRLGDAVLLAVVLATISRQPGPPVVVGVQQDLQDRFAGGCERWVVPEVPNGQ